MARKPKALTREQLKRRKERAVHFVEGVRDDPELAAQIEAESVEDYARHRGIELLSPHERRHVPIMATTKELREEIDDLQERVDEAISILEDAYTPEASREDLAEAAGNTLMFCEPKRPRKKRKKTTRTDHGQAMLSALAQAR